MTIDPGNYSKLAFDTTLADTTTDSTQDVNGMGRVSP